MRAAVPGLPEVVFDDELLAPYAARADAAGDAEPVRLAFAAAHVVMRASYARVGHSAERPGSTEEIGEHIDWSATMDLRRHLDDCGLGVAEAMDTAQRFAIGWRNAERLIVECGGLGLRHGFVAGAGTDHLPRIDRAADLVDGAVHQVEVIQRAGGLPMLLPMPWLSANAAGEDDYVDVYGAVFRQCRGPLFVHWLGEMFLPELAGYFPGDSFRRVMALAPDVVRGCKLSLLDATLELRLRRELATRGQIVLTGDDFHFADLIGGDTGAATTTDIGGRTVAVGPFSHALLGVLDGVAVPAGLALRLLAQGDRAGYDAVMRPCETYGQVVFEAPTRHYKAGLAFTAWLDGRQGNRMLPNHEQQQRDRAHYLRVAAAAAHCGAITDAAVAAERLAEVAAP